MIPVTYGYARVSKSDRDDRNLETQLRELANHGIRGELIFSDVMTGRLMSRPGWDDLMARVQSNDTIVLVWLDRFSRNFDEGVRIQADLTSRNIGIVAIKEGIDTTDDSAAAKYFHRMMMANGAYQADSTSERIKVGQECKRRRIAEYRRLNAVPPAIIHRVVADPWMVRRMYKVDEYLQVRRAVMVDGMSIRETARTFGLRRHTVRKMLAYSVPPGYRRQNPPRRPKLEPYTGVIDRILKDDLGCPRKQRHTAKRIFERLRDEYGFDGGYTTVKDYVRENRRQTRKMFVPLSHAPGHAQCDFGEALVATGGRSFHSAGIPDHMHQVIDVTHEGRLDSLQGNVPTPFMAPLTGSYVRHGKELALQPHQEGHKSFPLESAGSSEGSDVRRRLPEVLQSRDAPNLRVAMRPRMGTHLLFAVEILLSSAGVELYPNKRGLSLVPEMF